MHFSKDKTIEIWRTMLVLGTLGISLILTSCQPVPPTQQATPLPSPTPIRTPTEIVERYLNCEDCLEGELKAVLALGDEAAPILLEFLVTGPSAETLRSMEAGLIETYEQMTAYARTQNDRTLMPRQSQEVFVSMFLDNLTAQYQTRTIRAVILLDESESLEKVLSALEGEFGRKEREDLRNLIIDALGEMR